MGTTTLTRPQSGAWLHRLVRDPMVAIGPEAVTLIQLGLADRSVVDFARGRDAAAPLTHDPADPASPRGWTGTVPPPHVVRTLQNASQATAF
jgi:hypothetical protein